MENKEEIKTLQIEKSKLNAQIEWQNNLIIKIESGEEKELGIENIKICKRFIEEDTKKIQALDLAIESLKERPVGKWILRWFHSKEENVKTGLYECPFCHRRYSNIHSSCL